MMVRQHVSPACITAHHAPISQRVKHATWPIFGTWITGCVAALKDILTRVSKYVRPVIIPVGLVPMAQSVLTVDQTALGLFQQAINVSVVKNTMMMDLVPSVNNVLIIVIRAVKQWYVTRVMLPWTDSWIRPPISVSACHSFTMMHSTTPSAWHATTVVSTVTIPQPA